MCSWSLLQSLVGLQARLRWFRTFVASSFGLRFLDVIDEDVGILIPSGSSRVRAINGVEVDWQEIEEALSELDESAT